MGPEVPWISLHHFATPGRGSKAGLGFRSLGCKKQIDTRLKADLNQEHLCWCHWFMDIYNPGTSVCQCLLLRVGRKCVACEAKTSTGGSRRNKDGPSCKSWRKQRICALMTAMPHAVTFCRLVSGLMKLSQRRKRP